MRPLTLDDLLPLEEYACRRREYFESTARYIDRYRRVRLGSRLVLLFVCHVSPVSEGAALGTRKEWIEEVMHRECHR